MPRITLLLALLLTALSAAAQDACPRVWQSGDTLWTDPAEAYQWHRNGQPVPGANQRFYLPPDSRAETYSVEVFGINPPYAYEGGAAVNYALRVQVFDRFYAPLANARVRVGAVEGTTDSQGIVRLTLSGPVGRRVTVRAERDGYLAQTTAFISPSEETTKFAYVRLTERKETHALDAARGGTVSQPGFWLSIPPNGVVDEQGAAYSGRVSLQVESVRPSDVDFSLRMPGGDFMARNWNGQPVILTSYGFVGVELWGSAGQRLNLAPNTRAQLRFLIEREQQADAPAQVPLWHFDETEGIWTYEGEFTREGSFYRGEVSHFSWWNCDYQGQRATVRGRVVDCSGDPLPGGLVPFGQMGASADSLGNFEVWVAAGVRFDVINSDGREVSVGPFAANETTSLDVVVWREAYNVMSAYYIVEDIERENELVVNSFYPIENQALEVSFNGGQSWSSDNSFSLRRSEVPKSLLVRDYASCQLEVPVEFLGINTNCGIPSKSELDSLSQGWIQGIADLLRGYFDEEQGGYQAFSAVMLYTDLNNASNPLNQLDRYGPCLSEVVCDFAYYYTAGTPANPNRFDFMQLPNNLRRFRFYVSGNPDSMYVTGLPPNMESLPLLEEVSIYGAHLLALPDWSALQALENVEITAQYDLNRYLEGISRTSKLKSLKLGYAEAATETLSIPSSFADLADTLRELDLSGCRVTAPAERQRIQNLLPNTTITW